MDWKDVGKLIAPLAPMAGSILGGLVPFPGGSFIGQKLGEMIAGAFGVPPTPQAVSEAIANSTEETARAKINAAVEQARIQVQGFVDIERAYLHAVEVGLAQVNETMRAEIGHEHWYFTGWRPAAGWTFVLYANVYGAILMAAGIAAAFFDSSKSLDVLTNAWPLYVGYFGALAAMVGVYIVGRSQEKVKAVEVGSVTAPVVSGPNKGGTNPTPSQVGVRLPTPPPSNRSTVPIFDRQAPVG